MTSNLIYSRVEIAGLAIFIPCSATLSAWARRNVNNFHTHGGGGVGLFEKDIAKMCSNSTVTKGFGVYNRGDSETVAQIGSWLASIGLL